MPVLMPFEWSEDANTASFVLQVRGAKAKAKLVDVALCDVFVKVNLPPALFEVDLLHEIDVDDPKTKCKIGADKVTLTLKKKTPGLWGSFRATGTKAELRERRREALAAAAAREEERRAEKAEWKLLQIKSGETEQWRLDSDNREQIEKWEKEEKEKWEKDFYAAFDNTGDLAGDVAPQAMQDGDLDEMDSAAPRAIRGPEPALPPPEPATPLPKPAASPPPLAGHDVCEVTDEEAEQIRSGKAAAEAKRAAQKDAIWTDGDFGGGGGGGEEMVEYTPPTRETSGKMVMPFTERPRQGVPVRDRGQRPQPFPQNKVKSEAPPMVEEVEQDEDDPVWLKDKGDGLMVAGDFEGAHNAYTSALKLALNVRCFANRSVASLYLGNLEQCIEDGTRALGILDQRQKAPHGQMAAPEDPANAGVRSVVEVRIATAYLWLGAFKRAEEHFEKALAVEDGLNREETLKVREDLARVRQAKAALVLKERADHAARGATGGGSREQTALETALGLYGEGLEVDSESAVLYANRCFAHLRAGQLEDCVADAGEALKCLKEWPIARRAPKKPARPARLDPPYLDDPTFKHPDEAKKEGSDWLMKHGGGTKENLPALPVEYEWVKDAAEKDPNAWIAIRKKMSKVTIDAIRKCTAQLQDAVYTRNPDVIAQAVEVAIKQNRSGEGPSNTAISEAEKYAEKVTAHNVEREEERVREDDELRRELEECDLEAEFAPSLSGKAQAGLGRSHPTEATRCRLFVKVRLRRARAFELLGDPTAAAEELQSALRAEPRNAEARRRLKAMQVEIAAPLAPLVAPIVAPSETEVALAQGPAPQEPVQSPAPQEKKPDAALSRAAGAETSRAQEDDGDEDEEEPDHGSTSSLIGSAVEYMRRDDYRGAHQVYSYLRKRRTRWESPLIELKVLSNQSLCLQRMRGMLPELVTACGDTVKRIAEIHASGGCSIPEETLLRMECAALSRRGNAYAQQQKPEESEHDASRVRELVARLQAIENPSTTN